nr:GNAT family protein [Prolixibacteraceae bacterium]
LITNLKVSNSIDLKLIELNDATVVYKAIDENRAFFRKWLPFIDATKSAKDTYSFIKSIVDDVEHRQELFTVWYNGIFVGLIGLKDIDFLNRKLEIGYWIIEEMTGNGIVTRSIERIIQFIFEKMELNRIQIKCGVGNKASSAIPKRLGFSFEGIERQGEKHFNTYLDLEVYSFLREEDI